MPEPLPRDIPIGNVQRLMILRTFSGFAHLSPTELSALAEYTREHFYPAGAVIARAGEPVRAVHFIVDGAIQLNIHGHPLMTVLRREAIGGISWLTRATDTPELIAVKDTVTLDIATDDMEDLFEDNFNMMVGVLRAVARSVLELRRQMGPEAGFKEDFDASTGYPARSLDLVERIFFLRRSIQFAQTRIEALAHLARDARELRLDAGEPLWRQGEPSDRLVFPVHGVVQCETAEGHRFRLGPGGALGGLDVLADEPRWFSATTASQFVGLEIDTELFLDVFEDHYEMARDFMTAMARALMELRERLAGHHHHEPDPAVSR